MIDHVAPIYRRLIYEFLSPQELARLGETCKTFYEDKNRNDLIISKISSNFGYKIDRYYWKNEYLSYSLMKKELIESISQEFKKRTLSFKFKKIEDLSRVDKRYLFIYFRIELFKVLDIESQKEITLFLCDQLYHMWNYAKKKGMNMSIYEYRCPEEFDLYPLYNFIKDTLENIFLQGADTIKYILIKKLIDLTNITKNIFPKRNIENDIDIEYFIYSLFKGDITNLTQIIEIGLFFDKYFPTYLSNYLDNIFSYYLGEDTETYSYHMEEILDQKNQTYPEHTNADVLDDLLLKCKLYSVSLIREENRRRQKLEDS